MKNIMKIAGWIDLINIGIGKISIWMIFAATAISAGNALVRYIFWHRLQRLLRSSVVSFRRRFHVRRGLRLSAQRARPY